MIARACRRIILTALVATFLAGYGVANFAPAQESTGEVAPADANRSDPARADFGFIDLVTLDGPLDPVTVAFLEERVSDAQKVSSQALILQLDTPGAIAGNAGALVDLIARSEVPVVVWVGPGVGRSESAGVAVFLAAHVRAMSPAARVGRSEPRDLRSTRSNDGGNELASLAAMRLPGNPPDSPIARFAFESAQGFSLIGDDAAALGVADFVAPTIGDAVVGLDGRKVTVTPEARRDGATWISGPLVQREIRTARVVDGPDGVPRREPAVQVRFFRPSFTDRVLHAVASPSIAYFVLLAGLTLIGFELYTVGVGIVGLAGAVCVALASSGLAVVGPLWVSIALFVLVFVMLASDIQEGVRGPASAIAFAALLVGLALLRILPPPPLRVPIWLVFVYFVVIAGSWRPGMALMVRTRYWAPALDRSAFVGREVEVREPLTPRGTVKLGDGKFAARAAKGTTMRRGERGTVTAVAGSDLVIVEPRAQTQ